MESPATSTRSQLKHRRPSTVPHLRWYICGLLLFASSINYIDRQTISVLKPYLQTALHWSESDYGWIVFAFQLSYAVMLVISGRIVDRLGTRAGYALAMVWWSLAAMAHALARGAASFGAARLFLGVGEAGNFPASIKAVAEWFPTRERALATGVFNAGTNVGALLAPPLVAWLTLEWNWRVAFIFTGGLGFIWLVFWLLIYRLPRQHPWLGKQEAQLIESGNPAPAGHAESKTSLRTIIRHRQTWGFIFAKFLTDPIWWFYVYWLPSYLEGVRGFSLKQIGLFAGIPFWAAGFGSVAGGWLSSLLIGRGWSVNKARKTAMLVCALCMPAGIGAVFASHAAVALALISIAASAHQGWSANIFTLASDMFPNKDVATVVGTGGTGGAVGGMILAVSAGYILQRFHSYVPLFIIAGIMHPLAMAILHLLIPTIEPVKSVYTARGPASPLTGPQVGC